MAPLNLLSQLLLMVTGVTVYFHGIKASTIVETRGSSICTYRIDNGTNRLANPNCLLDEEDFAVVLATDANEETFFFSDIRSKKLYKYREYQVPVQLLYGLGSVEGIAVDWLTKNLYWTDFELNHVCVSRYDGRDRAILVRDDVLNPRGIVTEPFSGLIFWTDFRGVSDQEGRIERSYMDGSGRVAIVDDNLIAPSGLVIDFELKRLYFADRGTDKIESVTYDGEARRLLYQETAADFFDITIYGNVLYATIWRPTEADGKIMAISFQGVNQGQVLQTLEHSDQALGITTLDADLQPPRRDGLTGACGVLNGGCDHLCLPTGARQRVCACRTGYQLADDGVSCQTDYTDEHFLLCADASLHTIFQIDVFGDEVNFTDQLDATALAIDDLNYPVALAYDHVDGMVYWTDRGLAAIGRAKLDGSMKDSGFIGDLQNPSGIAVDTRRRLLYWTDEEKNEIGVVALGVGSRVFIDQDLDEPRAIAVNWQNGDVYWTDWGAAPKIERVSRDGTNREVLVDEDIGWLNCLALDPHNGLMYWCDAQNDRIELSDLDGSNRWTMVEFSEEAHPFALVIYDDYIYWTDWLEHSLTRTNRWTVESGVEQMGKEEFLGMQGLVAFETADTFEVEEESSVWESESEVTSYAPASSTTTSPPPVTGALNLTLIIAAAGGGLALLVIIILAVCCVVKCSRSKGSSGPEDHVPMSVRSTSFVGSFNPSGLPSPVLANNNPPPLPPAREKNDHLYEDLDQYQKPDNEYQAYLNPVFREDDAEAASYSKRIAPSDAPKKSAPAPPNQPVPGPKAKKYAPKPAAKPAAKPAPKLAAKPLAKPPAIAEKAPLRPDDTYLTPDAQLQDDYMALRVQTP